MEASTIHAKPRFGTLLWIGPRDTPEYREVYANCEGRCSQIAWRSSFHDVFARPATEVNGVLIARTERLNFPSNALQLLRREHSKASFVELLGPLCSGDRQRHSSRESSDCVKSFYWYESNRILCELYNDEHARPAGEHATSILIIAAHHQAASPLLELAAGERAVVTWSRHATEVARNFGVVWWDDSAARPTTSSEWRARIETFTMRSTVPQSHVWIANSPQPNDITNAKQGGIRVVVRKPFPIDALTNTIRIATNPLEHQKRRVA